MQNRAILGFQISPGFPLPDFSKASILFGMAIRTPNEFNSRRDRWQAAPETTFRESEYIDRLSKSKTQVVVKLIDGEEVRGWIEYYDKDIIRVTRATQPNLFIYKSRVKYIFEDPEARKGRANQSAHQ